MPFVLKKYPAVKGKKIQLFLLNEVGLTMSVSQKLLAKKRVFKIYKNSSFRQLELLAAKSPS